MKVLAERRRRPGDDLASALCAAEIDGEKLSDKDIIGFLYLLIIAGNETTTKLLANAVYWLAKHPAVRKEVTREPGADPAVGGGDAALRQLDPAHGAHR